jgi:8-hydroxy-5-deazaflavin:NADPH oxidoreductase
VVVVDTGNYYPRQRDGRIDDIENGMLESRWVALHLGRAVVKAFNIMVPDHLFKNGRTAGSADRKGIPVAGDERRAKEIVLRLVEELGFDAIDAGSLDESWRQQPGTPIYGTDLETAAARRALADAGKERQDQWRATQSSPGTQDNPR